MNVEHEAMGAPEMEKSKEAVEAKKESPEVDSPEKEQEAKERVLKQYDDIADSAEEGIKETFNKGLTAEQMEDLKEAAHGLETLVSVEQEMGGEEEGKIELARRMITQLIENRYEVTIEEYVESQRPTKLEWLMPLNAGMAELSVWMQRKALDIERPDHEISTSKKLSVKFSAWADGLKIAALAVPGIGVEAAIALEGAQQVLRRSAEAAKNISEDESMTNYGASKEMTLALLPRNEAGEIDVEKTADWVKMAAEGLASEEVMERIPEGARGMLGTMAEKMKEDPSGLIERIQEMDKTITS